MLIKFPYGGYFEQDKIAAIYAIPETCGPHPTYNHATIFIRVDGDTHAICVIRGEDSSEKANKAIDDLNRLLFNKPHLEIVVDDGVVSLKGSDQ